MEKITSRENAKIKYACRLASSGAFRRSEGKFLAEGRKLCPELCRGAALETLFCTEAALEKCTWQGCEKLTVYSFMMFYLHFSMDFLLYI